jgi:tight adherence protein B
MTLFILLIVAGLAVLLTAVALPVYRANLNQRAKLMRKAAFLRNDGGEKGDAATLRLEHKRRTVQTKLKNIAENKRLARSRIGRVRLPIIRAGLDLSLTHFWIISIAVGFACTFVYIIGDFGPAPMAPGAFVFGTFLLPQIYLKRRAAKRQKEFTKYFPDAVDVLVRGLKSGLPVGECFRIIARESPAPVGPEFTVVMDQVHAGLDLPSALDACFERVPTQELRFFATVISVQQQTGGNLAEILGNISSVLRGRAQLREKAKALAGEATASAAIIGSLPFLIGGVLFFVNRPYLSTLWTTSSGHMVFFSAVTMMTIGVSIMKKMGKVD